MIDIGVANGINQANSIQFLLSDEQAQVLRTEALKEATDRAAADARTVAAALGVNISSVKSVDVGGAYSPRSCSRTMRIANRQPVQCQHPSSPVM